jgi:hypothetical protein
VRSAKQDSVDCFESPSDEAKSSAQVLTWPLDAILATGWHWIGSSVGRPATWTRSHRGLRCRASWKNFALAIFGQGHPPRQTRWRKSPRTDQLQIALSLLIDLGTWSSSFDRAAMNRADLPALDPQQVSPL